MLAALFDSERGFRPTFVGLFSRPGNLISDYVNGITVRYTNPVRYLIVIVAIVQLVISWSGGTESLAAGFAESVSSKSPDKTLEVDAAQRFVEEYLFVLLLLGVPVAALLQWLFFPRSRPNFTEHLVFSCYVYAQQILIIGSGLVLGELIPSIPDEVILVPTLVLPLAYYPWAIVVFLDARLLSGIFRSIVISMLGILTSGVIVTFVAGVIRGLSG